jgi:hypothetical protein
MTMRLGGCILKRRVRPTAGLFSAERLKNEKERYTAGLFKHDE